MVIKVEIERDPFPGGWSSTAICDLSSSRRLRSHLGLVFSSFMHVDLRCRCAARSGGGRSKLHAHSSRVVVTASLVQTSWRLLTNSCSTTETTTSAPRHAGYTSASQQELHYTYRRLVSSSTAIESTVTLVSGVAKKWNSSDLCPTCRHFKVSHIS
eukprot:6214671-Pleurochrysis_carterae.AAC.4